MLNLQEARPRRLYRVTWMIGDLSKYLKERCGLQVGSVVYIIQNRKGGWIIFTVNSHAYGIGPEAAFSVKVEPV